MQRILRQPLSTHGEMPWVTAARGLLNEKRGFATPFSHFSPVRYGPMHIFFCFFLF